MEIVISTIIQKKTSSIQHIHIKFGRNLYQYVQVIYNNDTLHKLKYKNNFRIKSNMPFYKEKCNL